MRFVRGGGRPRIHALRRALNLLPQNFPVMQGQHMRLDGGGGSWAEKLRSSQSAISHLAARSFGQVGLHRPGNLAQPLRHQRRRRPRLDHRADKAGADQGNQA